MIRSVSSFKALVQAIQELRDLGHPVNGISSGGELYDVRVGRRIYLTGPIQCEHRIALEAGDSGLEIISVGFSPVFGLDLVVTGGAYVRIEGLSVLGMDDPLDAPSISLVSGALFLDGGLASGTISVDSGSLLVMRGVHAPSLDVTTEGQAYFYGCTLDDLDMNGGSVQAQGTRFGDVDVSAGSGSMAYASCASYTSSGGTVTPPVTSSGGSSVYQFDRMCAVPGFEVQQTAAVALNDLRCTAAYMGRAIKDNPTCKILSRVSSLGTVVAAEKGVATGDFALGGGVATLTVRGSQSFTPALGANSATVTTSGISAGDHLWALLWIDFTTSTTWIGYGHDRLETHAVQYRDNAQPSAAVGANAFTVYAANVNTPALIMEQT